MIAPDSDSGAVLLLLVWFVFTDHFGVCVFSTAFGWDVFVSDDMEGLHTFDSLLSAGEILANALVETLKFVGVRHVPDGLVSRMTTESKMFESYA